MPPPARKKRRTKQRNVECSPCEKNISIHFENGKEIFTNTNTNTEVFNLTSEHNKIINNHTEGPIALLKQSADIPLNIIKSIVKRTTGDVSVDICHILANYCGKKLTDVIKSSIDYMNRSGRVKFTAGDFNKGLYFCGEEPFMQWELLSRRTDPKTLIVSGEWLNNNVRFKEVPVLSNDLQKYFNQVTQLLLNETEERCRFILNDFETNECISQLVPYFVEFFCYTLDKGSTYFLRMYILLKSMQSLLSNRFLYFGQLYYNKLANAVLEFLFAHLPYFSQKKDCWLLKDLAANVLAYILKLSRSKKLFFEVISKTFHILCDFQSSLVVHYGALAALNSVGVPAILMFIPSNIHRYCKRMNIINASNYQEKLDICMIRGKIMQSYYLLVDHYFKYEFNISRNAQKEDYGIESGICSNFHIPFFLRDNKVLPVLLQSHLNEYFGDTLVLSFPFLNFVSYNSNLRKRKIKTVKVKCFKNSSLKKDIKTRNIHESMNEIFDIVPFKKCKISFGKIATKINET